MSGGTVTLNVDHLREVTMDDGDLMQDLMATLLDDTSRQMGLLAAAIEQRDGPRCMRLAHYSTGACANLGADAAAHLLKRLELEAAEQQFAECQTSFAALTEELGRLREAAARLAG